MGMTSEQELPLEKREETKWTVRRLFPFAGAATAFSKTFVNVFDVLLGLLVLAIVTVEIVSGGSILLYVFSTLVLAADVYERTFNKNSEGVINKKN